MSYSKKSFESGKYSKYNQIIKERFDPTRSLVQNAKKILGAESNEIGTFRKYIRAYLKHIGYKYNSFYKEQIHEKPIENIKESSIKIEEAGNSQTREYTGRKSLTSKEEAIEFFKIDLNIWEVERYIANSWDVTTGNGACYTNYQIKLWLIKREKSNEEIYSEVMSAVSDYIAHRKAFTRVGHTGGSGIGIACIADIHTGATVSGSNGLLLTKDFNLEILIQYLISVADHINSYKLKEVHLSILGDIIESLTGLNHINSWWSMDPKLTNGNVVIASFEILDKYLISRINNLKKIRIVAGNHDRATERNDQDVSGTVAKIVSYMLELAGYDVEFHPMLIHAVIDNISYIFTHNHLKFTTKDLTKIFFEYGKQGHYNVLIGGHWHSRNQKKPIAMIEGSGIENIGYRSITVAPLFTGNFYSESLGYTSYAGFSLIKANDKKDNIHHFDISL